MSSCCKPTLRAKDAGWESEYTDRAAARYCLVILQKNPTCLIARTTRPFISPSESFELEGQVMPTCFLEGLVSFHGRYYMYYGTADSKVAIASAPQE